MKFRIFISSVQREFARERRQLAEYIRKDSDVYLGVQVMLFKDRLEIWNAGSLPRGWTVKDLYRPHTSLPPNELIAGPMYLKGYIEKTGTGTDDVIRNCKAASIPPPVFTDGPDFRAVLYRRDANIATKETATETTQKTTQKILAAIVSNPSVTRQQLSVIIGITPDGVKKALEGLKFAGLIRRIGPDKGGHWEVVVPSKSRGKFFN